MKLADLHIPGPGAAMALAAGAAAVVTGLIAKALIETSDISDCLKICLFLLMLAVIVFLALCAIAIECLHVWKELKTKGLKAIISISAFLQF